MNASSVKPFSTASPPSSTMSTPSPPIPITKPVQEDSTASLSQQVFSVQSNKSLSNIGTQEEQVMADDEMPTLKPAAQSLSREPQPNNFLEQGGLGLASRSVCSIVSLQQDTLSNRLAQILGRDSEALQIYMSKEFTVKLKKEKFLQGVHTSCPKIAVDIDKKKGVNFSILLFPRITDGKTERAILLIKAAVKSSIYKKLNNEDCWVLVETSILDKQVGKSLGYSEYFPYAVTADDGEVNYRQDLVACDEVRKCRSNSVNLLVKAMLITCQRSQFKYTLHNDEEFTVVEKVDDE